MESEKLARNSGSSKNRHIEVPQVPYLTLVKWINEDRKKGVASLF